jgi:hypothetical protein
MSHVDVECCAMMMLSAAMSHVDVECCADYSLCKYPLRTVQVSLHTRDEGSVRALILDATGHWLQKSSEVRS